MGIHTITPRALPRPRSLSPSPSKATAARAPSDRPEGSRSRESLDPRTRLAPWPAIVERLEQREVEVHRRDGETQDALENRVGTGLMALYRDTRTPESFEALYAFAQPAVQQWIRGLLHRGVAYLNPAELLQDPFVNLQNPENSALVSDLKDLENKVGQKWLTSYEQLNEDEER